jgi:hypothetical protein
MFHGGEALHPCSSSLVRAPESRRPAAVLLAAVLTLLPLLLFGGAAGAASSPTITFGAPAAFPLGTYPKAIATGDLNGDGKPDMAVARVGGSTVSILLGNGAGGFSFGTTQSVGGSPDSLAAGDFDRDSHPDLAVANFDNDNVSILLGTGDGGFTRAATVTAGDGPESVATTDLNRDGKQDLVVANYIADNVSVRLGDGAGSFSAGTTFTVGTHPGWLVVGDLDRNSRPDLAIGNVTSNDVSIRLGNGDGTFSLAATLTAGDTPEVSAVADLNRDGNQDLVIPNSGSSDISVRLGTGTGTFTNGATVTVAGGQPQCVAVGDIDRDGAMDLAIASASPANAYIYRGDGAGGFSAAATLSSGTGLPIVFTVLADFDCDGRSDLAATGWDAVVGRVFVFRNATAVSTATAFGAARDVPAADGVRRIASGDFNSDGRLDMVIANGSADTLSVRLGDGAGGFTNGTTSTVGATPIDLATADFDRDGDIDVAAANANSDNVSIRLGNGSGGFSNATTLGVGDWPQSLATADFDRDGTVDLAVANLSGDSVSIRLGNGSGGFSNATTIPLGASSFASPIVAGDLDSDGNPDFAVLHKQSGNVSILLGDGAGAFSFGTTRTASHGSSSEMVADDLDRDGDLDLAVQSGYGLISAYINDGNGVFALGPDSSVGTFSMTSLSAGDFDRDGKTDLVASMQSPSPNIDNALVLLGSGTGAFPNSITVETGVGTIPRHAIGGDFDSDGRQDLAVAISTQSKVSLFTVDTDPPTTTLTTEPAPPDGLPASGWYKTPPQFGLTADEAGTSYYQWDATSTGGWQTYATTVTAGEGTHTLHYYSTDGASPPNAESVKSATVKSDTAEPIGTFWLDSGAGATNSTTVTAGSNVGDDGSGMGDMRFSADSTSAFGPWSGYAASAPVTLPAGDGIRTVHAEFRDRAGNIASMSDTIVLDSEAPTGTMVINRGAATTNNIAVTLDSTVTDSLSGMITMRWSNNAGGTWSSWVSYAPTGTATLALGVYPAYDGTRTITCEYKDAAGNVLTLADDIRFIRPKATVGTPVLSPTVPRKYVFFTTWGIINQKVTGSTRLYLYRRVAGRWVQYPGRGRYLNAKNYSYGSRTKYLLRLKVPYSGSWYVRPYYAGGPVAAANWGKIKFFTVR